MISCFLLLFSDKACYSGEVFDFDYGSINIGCTSNICKHLDLYELASSRINKTFLYLAEGYLKHSFSATQNVKQHIVKYLHFKGSDISIW